MDCPFRMFFNSVNKLKDSPFGVDQGCTKGCGLYSQKKNQCSLVVLAENMNDTRSLTLPGEDD